jgi:hypothetical protein
MFENIASLTAEQYQIIGQIVEKFGVQIVLLIAWFVRLEVLAKRNHKDIDGVAVVAGTKRAKARSGNPEKQNDE